MCGEVGDRPPVGHPDMASPAQRLDDHEQVGRPVPGVLVVLLARGAGRRRDRLGDIAPQILARLIEADHRPGRVVRLGVQLEHVLHAVDELAIYALG